MLKNCKLLNKIILYFVLFLLLEKDDIPSILNHLFNNASKNIIIYYKYEYANMRFVKYFSKA